MKHDNTKTRQQTTSKTVITNYYSSLFTPKKTRVSTYKVNRDSNLSGTAMWQRDDLG
jgi:hypothetical protein